MKTYMIMPAVLLAAGIVMAAGSDVLVTKTKRTLVGTVTNVTERNISIITRQGVVTYPWSALSEQTIKRYNPALYEELLEEKRKAFEELKRKQGLVQYKGRWMKPEDKEIFEKRDQGLDLYEGKWLPTNEIAAIKYRKQMEAEGKKEYKGNWYTEEELAVVKEMEAQKGLRTGMTEAEVIAKWGQPTIKRPSPEFASRKREMWIYRDEKGEKEDRLVFEMGTLREVHLDEELSEF